MISDHVFSEKGGGHQLNGGSLFELMGFTSSSGFVHDCADGDERLDDRAVAEQRSALGVDEKLDHAKVLSRPRRFDHRHFVDEVADEVVDVASNDCVK